MRGVDREAKPSHLGHLAFQRLGVVRHMVAHEGSHKEVAVVVTGLHTQLQRMTVCFTDFFQ